MWINYDIILTLKYEKIANKSNKKNKVKIIWQFAQKNERKFVKLFCNFFDFF